jgi:hypothetical protein
MIALNNAIFAVECMEEVCQRGLSGRAVLAKAAYVADALFYQAESTYGLWHLLFVRKPCGYLRGVRHSCEPANCAVFRRNAARASFHAS